MIGAAGTDILAGSVRDMITAIRIRQTGQAHLYHIGSGDVVASPQWDADQATTTMSAAKIRLTPAGKVLG